MPSFASRLSRLAATLLCAWPLAASADFVPGNLVVVRVGTGVTLTANATPTFLEEYTPAGAPVQTIALPTALAGSNAG